jgi:succinylglutamate desuccinylase
MKQSKIYVVACQHGDEAFGLNVLRHLKSYRNKNIITLIAHPEAVAKKIRFIESDINRSFGAFAEITLESQLANKIVLDIDEHNPDLIIDIHTSTVEVNEVAILAEPNKKVISFAKAIGVNYAAIMPESINQNTLIGQFRDRALSLEFGVGLRSDKLAADVAERINNLSLGRQANQKKTIKVLKIDRLIEKREAVDVELANYVYNEKLGGYPFLTGKDNYAEHAGFLALEASEI